MPVAVFVGHHRAEAVGVGIGGEDEIGLVLASEDSGAVHRFRHFRVRRLGDVGELAIRRHLLGDRQDAEALFDECFHGGQSADAVQRREDDLEILVLRRRHEAGFAAQIDVSAVRRLIEPVQPAGTLGLAPRQRFDGRHLIDEIGHDLIFGRHRLTAALIVELAAVVVGRIVRGRDVQSAVRLEETDGEGQLRRGQVVFAVRRQDEGVDAVGDIDAGGVLGEIARRQMQHRIGQVRIVLAALVLELAHVIGENDAQRLDAGKLLLEIFAMSLNGGPQRPGVHAIGTDADRAAPPAGAEGQDLIEAIEQSRPLLRSR